MLGGRQVLLGCPLGAGHSFQMRRQGGASQQARFQSWTGGHTGEDQEKHALSQDIARTGHKCSTWVELAIRVS